MIADESMRLPRPRLSNEPSLKTTRVLDWMVGRDGFEPSTNWLKANCSTTELTARSGTRILSGVSALCCTPAE